MGPAVTTHQLRKEFDRAAAVAALELAIEPAIKTRVTLASLVELMRALVVHGGRSELGVAARLHPSVAR